MGERQEKNVVLVGTGTIAEAHAEALSYIPSVSVYGVFDRDRSRAGKFAERYGVKTVYDSLDTIAEDGSVDAVHVLTPPPAHHPVCLPFLKAGKAVFVEKPMAVTSAECDEIVTVAADAKAALRTNQNFIFHPAHQKIRKAIARNRIGPLRRAQCRYVMPLRQLSSRQFGHWMFTSPLTLLLEQAVHPLSQLDDLMGPLTLTSAIPGQQRTVAEGIELITEWTLNFSSDTGPVQMQFALGETYHDWSVCVLGDDGRLEADYLANRFLLSTSGALLEPIEYLRTGLASGLGLTREALTEAGIYLAAQSGLRERSDPFFRSIRSSIENFYQTLRANGEAHTHLDGDRGRRLVTLCEQIASYASTLQKPAAPRLFQKANHNADCVVIGGTGFIGTPLVRKIAEAGQKVLVIARNTDNLSSVFHHENIQLAKGSASDKALLSDVIREGSIVINLAHGGGGNSYEEVRDAMVGSAKAVADIALQNKASRLLHVSSIAALYLGSAADLITYATPPDSVPTQRADYARAKVDTEQMLVAMQRENSLPLALFRPGIVVGEGTSPFHSGVGLYNRERYCLGWSDGLSPLPFVLVDDVVDALYNAAFNIDGLTIFGKSFNLVGDVRPNARQYTELLAQETGRPLRFRGQYLWQQQAGEIVKWVIKRVSGRNVPFPSTRDLRSRGMAAQFETSFEKTTLKWQPIADRDVFLERAIKVHRRNVT
ncbi:MAG: Gfo/Idh/MocA family oxidoreductase [Pseudomonadota bacterium]